MGLTFIGNITGPQGETGPEGPQGLPGTGSVPADSAVAGYIATTGSSATQTAADARYAKQAQLSAYTLKTVSDALLAVQMPQPITIPAAMGATILTNIQRTAAGQYSTGLNPQALHTPSAGPTYYVDIVAGSNSNNGLTWATAFKDAQYASLANSKNAGTIMVKAGVYTRAQIPSQIYSNGLSIIANPGDKVVFAACDTSSSWVTAGGSSYSVAIASPNNVLDMAHPDVAGNPLKLTLVASAAVVATTPGSWFGNSTTTYVNLSDGRAPDSNVLVSRAVNTLAYATALAGTTNMSTYVEGIQFWGGTTANLTAPGANAGFYAKNCKWMYTGTTNGMSVIGQVRVALLGCEASYNYLDGFNYHQDTSGNNGETVEVNCTGRYNGAVAGSNNGSTSHDSWKITRVGGFYGYNTGANVADVNNARAFNVGVSSAGSSGYQQDFYGGEMWCDSCFATSTTAFINDPTGPSGGQVNIHNCVYTGVLSGNVVAY